MDLNSLKWSEPKLVATSKGQRWLRKTILPKGFWDLWAARKNELRAAGYSPSKDKAGMWELCHWAADTSDKTEAVAASRAQDAAIEIPLSAKARELGFDYLPFQRAGIKFMSERDASLNADDMGVGKTIQIIGVMNVRRPRTVLIVCPASMLLTWRKELNIWLVENRRIDIVSASSKEFPADPQIVIINYDIVHKYAEELRSREWDLVAFDESQYCKNGKARRTVYSFGRAKGRNHEAIASIKGKIRICASGTPMKNRPIELFTQLHYLDPDAWPNFFKYAQRYCAAHQNRFGWDFSGASNLQELQDRLRSTLMIRRMKSEVLNDLPAKTRQVIAVAPNGHTQLIEKEIKAHQEWEAAKANGVAMGSVAFGELAKIRQQVGLAKVPYILSHLEEINQKTLLFVRHKAVQAKLAEELKDRGVVIVNGDCSPQEKFDAVEKFQTDPSCQFFIGTITACGVGLTLTAASYVLFGELEWTPADLSQAEDRAYRQGQKNAVLVQHLVFDGSLDDRMLVGILAKQRIIDRALDTQSIQDKEPEMTADAPEPFILPEEKPQEPRKPELIPGVAREKFAPLLSCLRLLSGMCDGARQLDGAGFNKVDSYFGKELARQESLSPRQALYAHKMVRKYKKQLPADLYESIYPPKKASDEEE